LTEAVCRQAALSHRPLAEVAAEDVAIRAHLSPAEVAGALDPILITAPARDLVRRTLDHRRQVRGQTHG
jgi:hypothetical protein